MNEVNSSLNIPITEKLKSIPGFFGIRPGEELTYTTIHHENGREIRRYYPCVLASVTMNGSFEGARKETFLCLANYIFGDNKDHKNLKMTSPVFLEPFHQGPTTTGWTMSFVLPFHYSLTTAPTPKDKRIHLQKISERLVASIRYSGLNSPEKIENYTQELMNWISKKHLYICVGETQSAQYDGPSTIAFLRKNEIHIEVRSIH